MPGQPLSLLNHRHETEKAPEEAGALPWTRGLDGVKLGSQPPTQQPGRAVATVRLSWLHLGAFVPTRPPAQGAPCSVPPLCPSAEALTPASHCCHCLPVPLFGRSAQYVAVLSDCNLRVTCLGASHSTNTECLLCAWHCPRCCQRQREKQTVLASVGLRPCGQDRERARAHLGALSTIRGTWQGREVASGVVREGPSKEGTVMG